MLTPKQKKQIRNLHKKGIKLREIARQLNINVTTVSYHANEETRKKRIQQSVDSFKKKPFKERKRIYKIRRPYIRDYQRRKYSENKDFRTREQKRSRDYYRKHSKPIEEVKGGKK